MGYGVKLEVWGDYAAFNRPEMKVERVSYEFLTPSAARGILEAIYWKPQMRWVIDQIHVLAPIRFTHVRRNELDQKIPAKQVEQVRKKRIGSLGIYIEEHRQQRASRILRDVRYGIDAHIEVLTPSEKDGRILEHPEAKHLEAFKRRASRGQCFHHPYLGCREFIAHFRLLEDGEEFPECPPELRGERTFGFMFWDVDFVKDPKGRVVESSRGVRLRAEARFFEAVMRDGILRIPPRDQTRG